MGFVSNHIFHLFSCDLLHILQSFRTTTSWKCSPWIWWMPENTRWSCRTRLARSRTRENFLCRVSERSQLYFPSLLKSNTSCFVGIAEYRKPILTQGPGLKDIKVNKGDKVCEPVVFTADPAPEIVLLKDGQPVVETNNVKLKVDKKDAENGLVQYTCTLNILEGNS